MKAFSDECQHTSCLKPRNRFGGRTQPFQTYAKADDGFTIEYYDYCSLYPWTNMIRAWYPMGQPVRITEDVEQIQGNKLPYRGVVYCDMLPPKNMPFAILP